jgi:hypothetical protein
MIKTLNDKIREFVTRGVTSAYGVGPQRTEEWRASGADGAAEGATTSVDSSRRRCLGGRRWCVSREAAVREMGGDAR